MTESEAIKAGFQYTGMSAEDYKFAKYKEEATELRKKYKGVDFRIVPSTCYSRMGTSHWKSIYGNDIFRMVQYYDEEREKQFIDSFEDRVNALKKEFEDKLKALTDDQNARIATYEKIQAMKK